MRWIVRLRRISPSLYFIDTCCAEPVTTERTMRRCNPRQRGARDWRPRLSEELSVAAQVVGLPALSPSSHISTKTQDLQNERYIVELDSCSEGCSLLKNLGSEASSRDAREGWEAIARGCGVDDCFHSSTLKSSYLRPNTQYHVKKGSTRIVELSLSSNRLFCCKLLVLRPEAGVRGRTGEALSVAAASGTAFTPLSPTPCISTTTPDMRIKSSSGRSGRSLYPPQTSTCCEILVLRLKTGVRRSEGETRALGVAAAGDNFCPPIPNSLYLNHNIRYEHKK
jgi:hypothetical protein